MPPSAYPSITTILPRRFRELPGEYPVSKSPDFADGGADFNLGADVKTRIWEIDYEVLTQAEGATLDAHVDSAKYNPSVGSAYAFTFTTDTGEVVANVRYDRGGYERPPHSRKYIQARSVRLIKRP